jgi:hypothetical protein
MPYDKKMGFNMTNNDYASSMPTPTYSLVNLTFFQKEKKNKQKPPRHRPMAHHILFRYLSCSTLLEEHAVHCQSTVLFVERNNNKLCKSSAAGGAGLCALLNRELKMKTDF